MLTVAGADVCRLAMRTSLLVCLKNSGGGQGGACGMVEIAGAVDGRPVEGGMLSTIGFCASLVLCFFF